MKSKKYYIDFACLCRCWSQCKMACVCCIGVCHLVTLLLVSLPAVGGVLVEKIQWTVLELGHLSHQAFLDLLLSCQSLFLAAASSLSSGWLWLALLPAAVALYYAHMIFLSPLNRVRLLEDIGYVNDGTHTKKEIANMVRSRRKVGEMPPVYPNGWFAVCESRNLAVGEAISVSCLGEYLFYFLVSKAWMGG